MFHNSQAVLALSRDENPTIFQKTLGINDFYFASPDTDYPLGNIQMVGKSQAPMFRGEKPGETKLAPGWTWRTSPGTRSTSGCRPRTCRVPDNRVTLDGEGRVDARATRRPTTSRAKRLYHQLRSMLGEAAHARRPPVPPLRVPARRRSPWPASRTRPAPCRFGTDPATSVLDASCRAHEVDNLYVADTSVFPSIGAVNPALTAMANALRVGDHIAERLAV